MKKALLLVIAALMVPGVALAAKGPKHPPKTPMTTYVLKGTLSNYTAYDANTQTNGAITVLVSKANHHKTKTLKGQTMTFVVDQNTKITLEDGVSAINNGDNGIVKVRAAKKIAAADLATTLQQSPAKQVVGKGAPKP